MRLPLFVLALTISLSASAKSVELNADLAYSFGDQVQIQGARDGSSALATTCGTDGAHCACLLYQSATDTQPVASAKNVVSVENNAFYCTVPQGLSPQFAQLVSLVDNSATPLLAITTTLTLAQVLGPFPSSAVSGIFHYNCAQTFFEGEGVTDSSVTCDPGQHLGVISALYDFYIFRSGETANTPGGDVAFPSDICGRSDFLKWQCSDSTPTLQFGFLNQNSAPFTVAVTMTRAPVAATDDPAPLSSLYGYAALPDSSGRCPIGLVPASPFTAAPASITAGSLGNNPSSSFLNTDGQLNDTVISTAAPAPFTVSRQASDQPCSSDSTGDCTGATFSAATPAETAPFQAGAPTLCVIPANLIAPLF